MAAPAATVAALAVTVAALGAGRGEGAAHGKTAAAVLFAAAWIAFAVSAWLVRRVPRRAAPVLILAGAVAIQAAAGIGAPRSSDDLYRYVWDGRVQLAGIDPYRYAPAAPQLVPLREPDLWPGRSAWCVAGDATDHETGAPLTPGCTRINRPTVHTIYPPVAQAAFTAVALFRRGATGVRVAAGLLAVATTVLLLCGLAALGRDPRRAALWAWCPAVGTEAAANAHIDVAATLLAVAAMVVLARGRPRWGGALLGLAIATKLTPALLLPAALRRRPMAVLASVGAAVFAVYLPHLVAVGGAVVGYLPGYLSEEGYRDGGRFALLDWLVPARLATVLVVVAMVGLAAYASRRGDPAAPWHAGALVTGTALILASPSYSWYALLLVALVALGARVEWMAVAAAGYPVVLRDWYGMGGHQAQQVCYGLAAGCLVAGWWWRGRRVAEAGKLAGSGQLETL